MTARVAVAAITIDFGNTLVRTDRASFATVMDETAEELVNRGLVADRGEFRRAWAEERDRQFREEVPRFREVDIAQRAVRVLARLGGVEPPPDTEPWDDTAAAANVEPAAVDAVVEAYGTAFVERMRPVPDAAPTLRTLAGRGFALAILSNWPLASTIDQFAAAHGWLPYLVAVVVSERVGTIKPHPSIFRAAEAELGLGSASGRSPILHVGDDWAADVVGAARAGWRTAYLRDRQADTPLPTSAPGDGLEIDERVHPDLEISELGELPGLVELDSAAAAMRSRGSTPATALPPGAAG